MRKPLRNGGVLWLVLVFLILETFVSAFPQLSTNTTLQGKTAQWLVWAAWGWLGVNLLVSLLGGRKAGKAVSCECAFSLVWVFALLPLGLGVLVAMLTGNVRAGSALAWVSLPWAALLIWQTLHQTRS